ncbi:YqcI/YcgG family protein [Nonomuraea monospora]|uniref:YqcI/YcgG family protein n=1 Tax=Nonomuraea monospora TaxID=568818 RepID=A0ABN3CRQ6_9ACTN
MGRTLAERRSRLLTKEDLTNGDCQSWVTEAYEAYRAVITDPEFPCSFGTTAEAQGHIRYTWVDGGHDLGALSHTLADFIALSRAHPRRRHLLIAFFPDTGGRDFAAYERRFWDTLHWLRAHDPEPWPANIPSDPDHPEWEFCFAGDPMFVFPCIPAYRQRHSRRMGDHFLMCFQPRRVFFGTNRDDPGGERIRQRIYDRVRRWDDVPPHPQLVELAYGDTEMREWKQYVLPDTNVPLADRCPLHLERGPS